MSGVSGALSFEDREELFSITHRMLSALESIAESLKPKGEPEPEAVVEAAPIVAPAHALAVALVEAVEAHAESGAALSFSSEPAIADAYVALRAHVSGR